jgi:glycosyltransferase 2 family protein
MRWSNSGLPFSFPRPQIVEKASILVLARKRWLRAALQAVALCLVAWGIWYTVDKAAVQLSDQQNTLAAEAASLRAEALAAEEQAQAASLLERARQLENQARDFWKAAPLGLATAAACYAVGMLPASLYWRRCLFALGQPAPTSVILWAYFCGNLGKYFPGKAMVIFLRLSILVPYGVRRVATSLTIFIETLTMMSVGGAVAAASLILLNLDWRLTALAVGLLFSMFAPTWPPLLRYLLQRLQPGVDSTTLTSWTKRIDWHLIAHGWAMLVVTWIGFGLSLWAVLYSLPSAELGSASTARLAFSSFGACGLAVVLGFVSMIPGGAGVREVVLSTVLTPVVGPTAALCGAIWMRVVWLATELFMAGATGAIHHWIAPYHPPMSLAEPVEST